MVPRKRGRPRNDWLAPSVQNSHTPNEAGETLSTLGASTSPSPEASLERPLHLPWGIESMELLYHYMSSPALNGRDTPLFRDNLARFAFRCHSVLHLILALSALHLARQEPHRANELIGQADAHMTVGLHRVNQILPNLSEQNCAELYIASILVCTCTFAKKPGPRHLLAVAEGQEVAWWQVFRGVRVVVETFGIGVVVAILERDVGTTPSAALEPAAQAAQPDVCHLPLEILAWEGALSGLSTLVAAVPEGIRKDVYQNALEHLVWCFKETYGTTAEPKPAVDGKFQTIMLWLYRLEDEFVNGLKETDPTALVILAHFAVLFQALEAAWFMRGWAPHVLQAVSEILNSSPYIQWIQWPLRQVESGITRMSTGNQELQIW